MSASTDRNPGRVETWSVPNGVRGSGAHVDLATPLLTPPQAAALLGVRTSWVYDAVRGGTLSCLRLGRHIRFSREQLERWLSQQL